MYKIWEVWINEKPVIFAWCILVALSLLSAFIPQPEGEMSIPPNVLAIFVSTLYLSYLFFILRVFRGKIKTSIKPPYTEVKLNIWSYFWRGVIVWWLLAFFKIPILLICDMYQIPKDGVIPQLSYLLVFLFVVPLLCLAMFTQDRRRKIVEIRACIGKES